MNKISGSQIQNNITQNILECQTESGAIVEICTRWMAGQIGVTTVQRWKQAPRRFWQT